MKSKFLLHSLLCAAILAVSTATFAQKQKYMVACVGFYNLENLFDTIKSPNTDDSEFLPNGINKWTGEKYKIKLHNMASVIRQIGTREIPTGPAILGVSEIENRLVLEDLVSTPPLDAMGYGVVQHEGNDARGVDVGLLYQKSRFTVLGSRSVRLTVEGMPDFRTRDQLVVSGLLDGEPVHVIVMHWPSRRGGEKRSKPLRNAAAALCRSLVDSLYKTDASAKIIVMGDLNDDPDNESLTKVLKARSTAENTEKGGLYNPTYKPFKDGIGSLAYDDTWNLFDQIIVSQPLLEKDYSSYRFWRFKIFNEDFLKQKDGRYAGYPWRTYSGGTFIGGYSDHFPTYILLIKNAN